MRFFLTAFIVMMTAGCDNRSHIDMQESPHQGHMLNGSAVKAPWVNAQVQLYELDLSALRRFKWISIFQRQGSLSCRSW